MQRFALSPEGLRIFTATSSSRQAKGHDEHNFYFSAEFTRWQTLSPPRPTPPHCHLFSYENTLWPVLLRLTCALWKPSIKEIGLKAINKQMLSEPRSRKRMQLYEQDPGPRKTAVCFRSLWGPTWKWEFRGVAWQTSPSVYFSLLFYLWSKKLTGQTSLLIPDNTLYLPNLKATFVFLNSFTFIKLT